MFMRICASDSSFNIVFKTEQKNTCKFFSCKMGKRKVISQEHYLRKRDLFDVSSTDSGEYRLYCTEPKCNKSYSTNTAISNLEEHYRDDHPEKNIDDIKSVTDGSSKPITSFFAKQAIEANKKRKSNVSDLFQSKSIEGEYQKLCKNHDFLAVQNAVVTGQSFRSLSSKTFVSYHRRGDTKQTGISHRDACKCRKQLYDYLRSEVCIAFIILRRLFYLELLND